MTDSTAVTLAAALDTLCRHRAELEALGVRHAGIFGSVARHQAQTRSDIDILVDLDDEKVRGIFDYAGVVSYISDVLGGAVDVANRRTLHPAMRDRILAEAVYAF